jgi:hypothetical protein
MTRMRINITRMTGFSDQYEDLEGGFGDSRGDSGGDFGEDSVEDP